MDGPEDVQAEMPDGEISGTESPDDPGPEQKEPNAADGVLHQLRPEAVSASETGSDDDGDGWRNLHRMLDVPLALTVELGSTEMPLSEVLRLEGGSVITIDRMPGEPIDLLINGRVFARGEVVVINDTFGYRITELVDDAENTIQIGRDGE
jgi:flagellar motor switch protein FliN/FliY